MLGESENQFSLTRAALSTPAAQKQIPISFSYTNICRILQFSEEQELSIIVSGAGTCTGRDSRLQILRGCFLVVTVVLAGIVAAAAASEPAIDKQQVCAVARQALPKLAKAAAADRRSYGFEPGDDVAQAQLDEPFQVFALTADAISSHQPSDTLSNLLVATEEWIFPVQVNGSNRVVLIVRQTERGLKAIYFGNGTLARQLAKLRAAPAPPGRQVTLVSTTDIRSFWFSVQPTPTENLSPLADLKLSTGEQISAPADQTRLIPARESISKLAKALLEMRRQEAAENKPTQHQTTTNATNSTSRKHQ